MNTRPGDGEMCRADICLHVEERAADVCDFHGDALQRLLCETVKRMWHRYNGAMRVELVTRMDCGRHVEHRGRANDDGGSVAAEVALPY